MGELLAEAWRSCSGKDARPFFLSFAMLHFIASNNKGVGGGSLDEVGESEENT